jgi:apolipoprotein N-acyltransferase
MSTQAQNLPERAGTEPEGDADVRRRVRAKLQFYVNLVVFLLVGSILVWINVTTTPGVLWFPWVVVPWAVGLVAHYVAVLMMGPGAPLEERMIDRELGHGH